MSLLIEEADGEVNVCRFAFLFFQLFVKSCLEEEMIDEHKTKE